MNKTRLLLVLVAVLAAVVVLGVIAYVLCLPAVIGDAVLPLFLRDA